MLKKHLSVVCILLFVLVCVGCNTKAKVTGKVTLADGTTASSGLIRFYSNTASGEARIQSNGNYSAGEQKDGDGLPAGTYSLGISGVPGVAAKYADYTEGVLQVEVPASGNVTFDIRLDLE